MSFYRNGYTLIKGLVSSQEAAEMAGHLKKLETLGKGTVDEDNQNATSFYGDELMTKWQVQLLSKVEKATKLELYKTYTYARIYKKGSILRLHRDRPACEVSITLDLGGDPWNVWLLNRYERPIKVQLNPGDALVYRGCELYHWRAQFNGTEHTQVFMHYVDKYGPLAWAKDDIKKQP